jgi:hypothetical protein
MNSDERCFVDENGVTLRIALSDVLKDYLVAGYYYCHYPLFGEVVPTRTPTIIEIDEIF